MISGNSRGIGLATARTLAAKGYSLSLGARDLDALEAATAGLPPERTLCCCWQAEDAGTAKAWVARTSQHFGRIDAAVANAGLSREARLEDEDESDYALSLPNDASVAELLVNCRMEAMF